MGFLVGLLLIWIGISIIRASRPKPQHSEIDKQIALAQTKLTILQLQNRMTQQPQQPQSSFHRELSEKVALDALRRESLMRTALLAVLDQTKAPKVEVDKLLAMIDEPEREIK